MNLLRSLVCAALLVIGGWARGEAVVGQPAPDFTLTDLHGETHHLSEYRGKVVVLEWTNPECPIVGKHYDSGNMPRLQKEARAAGVVWLSINSGHAGAQGDFEPAQVQAWLQAKGGDPTDYFRDRDGKVGHLYGAKATPNMFVVTADGILAYAGAIDSIPSAHASDIPRATNYVRAALASIKAGKPVAVATSRPYGCSVKY